MQLLAQVSQQLQLITPGQQPQNQMQVPPVAQAFHARPQNNLLQAAFIQQLSQLSQQSLVQQPGNATAECDQSQEQEPS